MHKKILQRPCGAPLGPLSRGTAACAALHGKGPVGLSPGRSTLLGDTVPHPGPAGANVNAAKLHETALHHAAKVKNVDLIEMLVEFGGNIYARDNRGKKPSDYTWSSSAPAKRLEFYESEATACVVVVVWVVCVCGEPRESAGPDGLASPVQAASVPIPVGGLARPSGDQGAGMWRRAGLLGVDFR